MATDRSNQCEVHTCKLASYSGGTKCILHCEKDESSGFALSTQFSDFYDALIEEIVDQAFSSKEESDNICRAFLRDYLKKENYQTDAFANNVSVRFFQIVFPERDEKYPFDYLQVLNKLGEIRFDNCKFTAFGLDIKGAKCFFQECAFQKNWLIYDLQVLANVNNVLYQQCTFNQDVNVLSEADKRCTINSPLFYNCNFLGNVHFECVDFKKPLFNDKHSRSGNLKNIELNDCDFSDRLVINNYKIEVLSILNSVFHSKLDFKNNVVDDFAVVNTNFSEIADLYGSKFELFKMERNIFNNFVGFENCMFGIEEGHSAGYVTTFQYVTFLSFANFRNARFCSGLNIELVNLKESPNFLNAYVPLEFTNRETFRIIKNSFDKIGNNIEANKFFVLEMKKYKQELFADKGKWPDKIVFCLNENISDFGQNYFRPMRWIVEFGILYAVLVYGLEQNALYKIYMPANQFLSIVSNMLNYFAANFLPYSKFLKEGMEFVSLLFYIIFLTLIWQAVIAIKRHVRR